MNVLSLFDGMSCGQIALDKLGIKVDNYFASEIDKYAIRVTQKNYPNTIQIGSVVDVKAENLPNIDLLYGGSPCQSFSKQGDGSGFDGKSKLFYEFVRLLKEVNPTYFLLENVVMKNEWKDIITESLGVSPIAINSKLISAQNRPRLYWTNIPNVKEPEDLNIFIKDVINTVFSSEYPNYLDLEYCGRKRKSLVSNYNKKANCLTASMYKGQISSYCKNDNDEIYKYTPEDCEVLQTVPVGYTKSVSNTQRFKMLGNGWTVDVIAHIFKNIELGYKNLSKAGMKSN
jgi:site-specific DNA-cytosine methylase